jgi:acyl-coenzyme A thioesterase PaaI-like protein
MAKTLRQKILFRMINYWPPYLGAGIHVGPMSPDGLSIEVEMKLNAWNRNYVGTQFGGSLYAMCDPFFMLILIENLGSDYIVWDKEAKIRFKKPGLGRVKARFHIDAQVIDSIKERLKTERKVEPEFEVQVLNDQGEVVAEISKLLYVRLKDSKTGSK